MTAMVFAAAVTAAFSFGVVNVDCEDRDGWRAALEREVAADGAEVAKITLDCTAARTPPKTKLSLKVPQVGMDYAWNVNTYDCGMRPNWGARSHTEVAQGRFPDMAAHVRRVHDLGIKYMMWYSVPFIGHKSENFERFKGKYLMDVPAGKRTFVMNASGRDSFVIRRSGRLSEISCRSGDWIEL